MNSEMKITKKSGYVPELRFPEFRKGLAWKEEKLANICNILPGYGFPEVIQGKKDGEYPFCKVSDISRAVNNNGGILKEALNYIDHEDLSQLNAKLLPCGTTVFAKIGEALRLNRRAISIVECLIDNNAVGLKAKYNIADDYFIYSLSQLINLNEYCGGAIPSVNKSILGSIDACIPSLDEQKKIADCLSSLDKVISLQTQKIDILQQYKKGLMQKLFPAEGKTVPELRFGEFNDSTVWQELILGELSQVLRGGSPRPIDSYLTNSTSGLNWLKIGDVGKDSKYVMQTKERVREEALSKTRVVNPGDLILSNSMSFGRPYILKIKSCIHDGWIAITKIKNEIKRDYLYYLIITPKSQHYFVNNAAGSGVQNLNADIIKSLPVVFPGHEEQEKIADCLSSLDELITKETQKLATLKMHKTGLMQQLFPAMDEVTA